MDRREFVKSFLCVPFFYATPSVISGGAWPIYRSWNFNEIIKYSQWVNQIYDVKKDGTSKQKGAKLDRIFKDDEMNLTNNPSFLEEGNVQFNDTEFFRDVDLYQQRKFEISPKHADIIIDNNDFTKPRIIKP